MSKIFISSDSSKTSDLYRVKVNLVDKMDLGKDVDHVVSSGVSIHYIWKNVKKLYKDLKFKIT